MKIYIFVVFLVLFGLGSNSAFALTIDPTTPAPNIPAQIAPSGPNTPDFSGEGWEVIIKGTQPEEITVKAKVSAEQVPFTSKYKKVIIESVGIEGKAGKVAEMGKGSSDEYNKVGVESKSGSKIIFVNSHAEPDFSAPKGVTVVKVDGDVRYSDGKVYVKDGEVSALPDEIITKLEESKRKVTGLSLEKTVSGAEYGVTLNNDVKVLGIFKANMETVVHVDAKNAEVKSESKPWWSFLAF
jgi:hypothetical protein